MKWSLRAFDADQIEVAVPVEVARAVNAAAVIGKPASLSDVGELELAIVAQHAAARGTVASARDQQVEVAIGVDVNADGAAFFMGTAPVNNSVS